VTDYRYVTVQARVQNRIELQQHLQEKIILRDSHEFINAMHRDFVPCARINNLATVFNEKAAQEMVREEIIAGQLTKRVSTVAFKLEGA
jgi:crotonobetainyl-CoA:carnitine CoA-transferase CaiB-like acyl-CoA transferase